MNCYLDIVLLPDPELSEPIIMSELFAKLHFALVKFQNAVIGISFPNVKKVLGNCLRLHGSNEDLHKLMGNDWIYSLRDYVEVSNILPIPEQVQYRVVKRVQVKSSVERLRRRSIAKGWLTKEEAIKKISLDKEKMLKLPFVQLTSTSTGQKFRFFIQHEPLQSSPVVGSFNAYGLSNKATVPWF